MKLNKRNKILIITALSIVLLGMVVIILLINKENKASEVSPSEDLEDLIEAPDFFQQDWWSAIKTSDEKPGYQTIVNEYDNYQIIVPAEWSVEELLRKGRGMQIFFGGEEYYESDLDVAVGLVLTIVAFDNPKKLSVTDWLRQSPDATSYQGSKFTQTQVGQYTSFKTSAETSDEELHRLEGVTAEYTLQVAYLLENKDKMYEISCVAYNDADTLIPLCEEQVQTFEILR